MKSKSISAQDFAPYAFWDTDASQLDLQTDMDIIVSRIFERAKLDDILNTIAYYGVDVCASIMTANRYISRQAMFLAHLLLSVPLKKFEAYAAPRNYF
jgi:hypothetical protein